MEEKKEGNENKKTVRHIYTRASTTGGRIARGKAKNQLTAFTATAAECHCLLLSVDVVFRLCFRRRRVFFLLYPSSYLLYFQMSAPRGETHKNSPSQKFRAPRRG